VTVHDPICTDSGDLNAALYGSFLPIPSESEFPIVDASEYERERLPGAIIAKKERIVINKGRNRIKLKITNTGDRPIQVRNYTSALSLQKLTLIFVGVRSGLIITSSKQILHCPLIVGWHMAGVWISQLEPPFDSNLGTPKP
jgi:hypothetical protein